MDQKKFNKGLEIRKKVLGEKYVNEAINNITDFNRPLQEFVTEYCWGEIWARPGISKKTRSIINLAMLTALNRPQELKIHLQGALNNGVTIEEIREIFLQSSIYCGVPAAIDSFKIAEEVLNTLRD